MRYIVVRTKMIDGKISIEALVSLTQKAVGVTADWMRLEEATTNFLDPEKWDLLSFNEDEIDEMDKNFDIWGFDETVAFIGVEPVVVAESPENVTSSSYNESQKS